MILTSLAGELMEGVMKKSTSPKIALRIRCWFWREFKGKKKGAFSSRTFSFNYSGKFYPFKA